MIDNKSIGNEVLNSNSIESNGNTNKSKSIQIKRRIVKDSYEFRRKEKEQPKASYEFTRKKKKEKPKKK